MINLFFQLSENFYIWENLKLVENEIQNYCFYCTYHRLINN